MRPPKLVIVWSTAARSFVVDLPLSQSFLEQFLDAAIDLGVVSQTAPATHPCERARAH